MSIKASGQTRIFLCHAKADREKVEQLYGRLKKEGFDPWLDSKNLLPGQEWEREIQKAIKSSDFFITCLSRNSVTTQGFLNREIEKGLEIWEDQPKERIYLIPARLEDCKVPDQLKHLQWVDIYQDEGWEKLLAALKTREPKPETKPPGTKISWPAIAAISTLILAIVAVITLLKPPVIPREQPIVEPIERIEETHGEHVTESHTRVREAGEIGPEPLPGMKFAWIPPGSFRMGSENGHDDEKPVHGVTITKGFYLQTTEVTQGQWREVMGEDHPGLEFKNCDDCPVEGVSWDDTQKFIKRLNEREGSGKYRLPTEAEWEYACRAGSTGRYYFGDQVSKLGEYAWYSENSGSKTHPVAKKKANDWGLYDMLGNVWEWCQDWKDDYNKGNTNAPEEPDSGTYKVLRGGSWDVVLLLTRCAFRYYYAPDARLSYFGFRCARTL